MKYVIGLDFGTLSARALLVDTKTGKEIAQSVFPYTHGVMSDCLPDGSKLPENYALQHPDDYVKALEFTVKEVITKAEVSPLDVVGVGVDFTACTVMPVYNDGTPLCRDVKFAQNKHAYVKLWKHHAAQSYADRMNAVAQRRGESFLKRYGNIISSEWLFPKAAEIAEEAPEVYDAADKLIEAGDWIVMLLTGEERRNSCAAGYKATFDKQSGYPTPDFIGEFCPEIAGIVEEKLGKVYPSGSCGGYVTAEAAKRFGLAQGTAVAVASIDAHAAVPAAGICDENSMLMIMGTSTCHMMLSKQQVFVEGISGVVDDGIIPGFYGYEAGQACVGDHFQWVTDCITPHTYFTKAAEKGMDIHEYLTFLAERQAIGENGLVALDWWNGVRTPLVNASLKGVIDGITLSTKVEDIYRTLIEATAFGTRKIIETFEKGGLRVDKIYACGGIAAKNSFLMQVYADVTGREIAVVEGTQTVALGSAIFAAAAAGKAKGGYDSLDEAVRCMKSPVAHIYKPQKDRVQAYAALYGRYNRLFEFFKDKC